MSVAANFRRTIGELSGEVGDIIMLAIGLGIFLYVLGPVVGIAGKVRGLIPTVSPTGTIGSVQSTTSMPYTNYRAPYNPPAEFYKQQTYFRRNRMIAPQPPPPAKA